MDSRGSVASARGTDSGSTPCGRAHLQIHSHAVGGRGRLRLVRAGQAFEPVEIVADRQGECQQLLQRLLGFFELDVDVAGLQMHAGRKVFELLIDDVGGGFHGHLGLLEAFLAEPPEDFGESAAALYFVIALLAPRQLLQANDQLVSIRQSVGSDPVADTGSQDLLGPAAADTQEEFDRGAIDERAGRSPEFVQNVI
jgi:hypothetical protein